MPTKIQLSKRTVIQNSNYSIFKRVIMLLSHKCDITNIKGFIIGHYKYFFLIRDGYSGV